MQSLNLKNLKMNSLKTLFRSHIKRRAAIDNDGGGRQKLGCVIFSKSTQYVLWDWDEPLQR